jgi:hypothetical protein
MAACLTLSQITSVGLVSPQSKALLECAGFIARTLIHCAGDWASQRLLAWRIAISPCESRRKASLN